MKACFTCKEKHEIVYRPGDGHTYCPKCFREISNMIPISQFA